MNERDERVRELLRAADPAAHAPELGEGDVSWMRQRVLRAASEVPSRKRAERAWALAGAAVLLALAVGLVLYRAMQEPRTAAAPRGASLRADASPSTDVPARLETSDEKPARHPSRVANGGVAPAPAPATAEGSATHPVELASHAADNAGDGAPSPSTAAPHRRRAPAAAEAAPRAVTIAQAPREREPYQLQLTAPGGTRIVWVLTADNGR